MDTATQPVIVLGSGPVGLGVALLLAQSGRAVTVYEAKDELALSDANSYPIGVNPRGQETLRRIDPALLDRLREHGEIVRGWRIFAGGRLVAKLASGTVWSTTRAFVNKILLEKAEADPHLTLVTGHKLARVDVAARRLVFTLSSGEETTVDAAGARVIAADGVWSATRRSLIGQVPGFDPEVGPWGVRFRVLFSKPGAKAPGLDPSLHYIFGDKGMYSATLASEVWCVAVTAIGRDGAALADAQVTAIAHHPLGTVPQRELRFVRDGAGRFVSTAPLIPGRWQITATVRSGGHQVRVAQPASL